MFEKLEKWVNLLTFSGPVNRLGLPGGDYGVMLRYFWIFFLSFGFFEHAFVNFQFSAFFLGIFCKKKKKEKKKEEKCCSLFEREPCVKQISITGKVWILVFPCFHINLFIYLFFKFVDNSCHFSSFENVFGKWTQVFENNMSTLVLKLGIVFRGSILAQCSIAFPFATVFWVHEH